MQRKKQRARLAAAFGTVPDTEYYPGDLERAGAYYRMRSGQAQGFAVDDDTWEDLDMDRVFRRVNAAHSTSGEQMLYYFLRCPAMDAEAYERRRALLALMEEDEELRLDAQQVLSALGKRRNLHLRDAFAPPVHGRSGFWMTLGLVAAFLGCAVGALFSQVFYGPLLLLALGSPMYHFWMARRLEAELVTVGYSAALVTAANRLRKRDSGALRAQLPALWTAGEAVRRIRGLGFASFVATSDLMTLANNFLHLDLLAYERLKRRLGRHSEEIETLHRALGGLDAAIAVASYRKSLPSYCSPVFSLDGASPLRVKGLCHPLLPQPVPCDLDLSRPMLVTGANASGKSTFLKAVALNALLAQGLCTSVSESYTGPLFSIYASMAVTDDLRAGDSYFIVELKSLKRIFDAAARGERVLCVVDEVLRGTNTVERIAASSAALEALAEQGVCCVAATHDGELCGLLDRWYRRCHFTGHMEGKDIRFDYQLREGPATSGNALLLLEAMDFAPVLVRRAQERAEAFRQTGCWGDAGARP